MFLCVANGVTLRSVTTVAPFQRVYKVEGFVHRLTITFYGYVKQQDIRADSKVATNQNGLQPVEHYALKYRVASVKSENSIFFYVIPDFFLRYACLSLSFLYPLVFPSSILSVVL